MSTGQRTALLAALAFHAASCASGEGASGDAGPRENGDAPPGDAGVRAFCPLAANAPSCMASSDCTEASPPPSNCAYCLPRNRSLCLAGQCESPPAILANEPYNVSFSVGGLENELAMGSFAWFVVSRETAGGASLGCEEIYAGGIDLESPCVNVLESRGRSVDRVGTTFTLPFTGFASGKSVLFLIYGFVLEGAEGDPIGVSCTEHEVGPPGSGGGMAQNVEGDMMRRIP